MHSEPAGRGQVSRLQRRQPPERQGQSTRAATCCARPITTSPSCARSPGTNSRRPARPSSISSSPSATTPPSEVCPIWPGQPMTAHWGLPDPAKAQGSEAERQSRLRRHHAHAHPAHRHLRQPASRQIEQAVAAKAARRDRAHAHEKPRPKSPLSCGNAAVWAATSWARDEQGWRRLLYVPRDGCDPGPERRVDKVRRPSYVSRTFAPRHFFDAFLGL